MAKWIGVIAIQRLIAVLILCPAALAQYAGSKSCQSCHADKFASQSKTGHAHALALAADQSYFVVVLSVLLMHYYFDHFLFSQPQLIG